MAVEQVNFFHSLAAWLAAKFSPALAYAPTSGKWDLFRNAALENFANDPYSVLTLYAAGPRQWSNTDRVAVQVLTVASQNAQDGGMTRAMGIYNALRDADGYPLRMLSIAGKKASDNSSDGHWLLAGVELLQTPGVIGRRDDGRVEIAFNLEVEFSKTT